MNRRNQYINWSPHTNYSSLLTATTMAGFIIVGHLKCFGIMFIQQQDRFGSSSSDTALIYTLQNIAFSITGNIRMLHFSGVALYM